jgi:Protein of unknown function (DUF3800)
MIDSREEGNGSPLLGEHLVIQPDTLTFYIDEAGDERLTYRERPIFAFGGVASIGEFHIPIAREWQAMKAVTFPQVTGPLHAKTHLRDRLSERKRLAVLAAMAHHQLGRFGTIITSSTIVPLDQVIQIACGTLANRLAHVAEGLVTLGLWKVPGRVVVVFEHSTRLARHIEQHFPDQITVGGCTIQMEGCFMPKSIANPFLEMADFVANTLGKNVTHQLRQGHAACTRNFQALFRDHPLADYIEVIETI